MPRRFPAAALALAIACVSFTTAVAIASLPRRLAAGLEPSANVAIREQFPCDPLPLGGTAPPGIKSICYYIDVPLNYSAPASGNLTVFVRRTFLDSPGRGDLLWMLPGGSGVPSWSETSIAAPLVYGLASINQTFDVLMMDKRGTGNSSYIGCPYPMLTAYDSCFDYLASNDSARRIFNSVTYTNTALDIKSTVDVLTDWTSRQEVFVMGSSNGAYLVQRYMMLAPDQADAIILDALLPPDLFRLIQNENNMNTLGLDVMGRCSADAFCRAQFNGTYGNGYEYVGPVQAMETLKLAAGFGDNPCLQQLNHTYLDFAESMANLLYIDTWSLSPPTIKRLLRCNADDLAAMKHFITLTTPPAEGPDTPKATILVEARNDWSELWSGLGSPNYNCEIMNGFHLDSFFANNVANTECFGRAAAAATGKFLYTPNPLLYGQYSNSTVPTLAMNGQMDQAVPVAWARHAARKYQSLNPKNFHYVELPRTAHVPSTQSPVSNSPTSCGFSLAISFLVNPAHVPDTSCLEFILPIDFAGTTAGVQSAAKTYFGTADLWGSDDV